MHVRPRGVALACAAGLALLSTRCTSASTIVSAPSSNKCQISVVSNPSTFTATGGQGSVAISTARDCSWSVAAEAPWLSIAGDPQGQGDGVVAYSVASNPVPASRTGTIVIGSERVQLSQAGASCRFQLSRDGDVVAAEGGVLSVDLTTLTGCSWTAAADESWINVHTGRSGNAAGTIRLEITANGGPARVGHVIIGGQTYTVSQAARDVTPAPGPKPAPAPGPTPAPTPVPVPTPAPSPIPAPSTETTTLDGRAFFVSGVCPNVSFYVDGRIVVAGAGTGFKGAGCNALSSGDNVKVFGTVRSDGRVDARQIDVRKDNDKHDDD